MNKEHSPLPWKACVYSRTVISDSKGMDIAMVHLGSVVGITPEMEEAQANREFILKCANGWKELEHSCKAFYAGMEGALEKLAIVEAERDDLVTVLMAVKTDIYCENHPEGVKRIDEVLDKIKGDR